MPPRWALDYPLSNAQTNKLKTGPWTDLKNQSNQHDYCPGVVA